MLLLWGQESGWTIKSVSTLSLFLVCRVNIILIRVYHIKKVGRSSQATKRELDSIISKFSCESCCSSSLSLWDLKPLHTRLELRTVLLKDYNQYEPLLCDIRPLKGNMPHHSEDSNHVACIHFRCVTGSVLVSSIQLSSVLGYIVHPAHGGI